jgi:hypothetical protein
MFNCRLVTAVSPSRTRSEELRPQRTQAEYDEREAALHGAIEQGHETEIHVQLLMAVKQGEAGIIGNEVDLDFLVSAYRDHIFHHPLSWLAGDAGQFKLWRCRWMG